MKNLFSKSLSKKKLAIISASFIVFSVVLGVLIFETTKNTVALTIDGQETVTETHAATINDLFEELNISLHSEDYLFPSADTEVTDKLEIIWKPAKQVQMVKGNEKANIWTTADTVEEFLKEQSITLNEHDKVQPNVYTEIKEGLMIQVDKAFSLTLKVGGEEKQVWSTSTTVADFLSQQGITLNELDRVEPILETTVDANTVVNVVRIEKVTDVVEVPVDYAVVTKKDSSLAKGAQKVVTKGQEGLVQKEYEVVVENGVETSRTLLKETTVKEKKDKVVAIGTKVITQTASRGSGTVTGEMVVNATAYTAYCNGCSGYTATGFNLRANPDAKVIAVDPSVIPLGTKVYVEGYGYAVAADKGSAIKGNKIDVFFSTKAEAYRWGRKKVTIKILD